jgi:hypothetical protein
MPGNSRRSSTTGGPEAYRASQRALTTIEFKNAKRSSGCVSKTWLGSSGNMTQGCLLRVQKCVVGRSQEVSSKVPARTKRNAFGFADLRFAPLQIHEAHSGHIHRVTLRPLSAVWSIARGSTPVRWKACSSTTIAMENALLVKR